MAKLRHMSHRKQRSDASIADTPEDSQDRLVRQMLKQYKRLEFAVHKFDSKHNGITKTNMLRTLVLPFLRLLPPLDALLLPQLKIHASLVSVATLILGQWWRLLLALLLAQGTHQVSATDRNAYLECISRIMARREWLAAEPDAARVFRACLTDTLDFCMNKVLAMKLVPISMSAFVGKVFAYAFFNLPGAATALLFLLNVKQASLDTLAAPPVLPTAAARARDLLPTHVRHLVDYRGLDSLERLKRGAINCVAPPKHPVKGIRDPSGPWLRRWCSSESDIFNSFFRHYVNIVDVHLGACPDVPPEAFPGFLVISAHIYMIFLVSVNRILANMSKTPVIGAAKPVGSPEPRRAVAKADEPVPLPSAFPYKHNDSNYTCIIKLFKTIRDISYSSVPFANHITRIVDQLLANVATSTSLYDFNKSGLLLNVVYEFSNHVLDTTYINWEFWLGCNYLMLTETLHVQIITRNFAFLFNVWDKIPTYLSKAEKPPSLPHLKGWLKDLTESFKLNFSEWLTSSDVWLMFFTHWNPLVRAHYVRLIVWRIIGVNNYESSLAIQTTRRIKNKLDLVFESVCTILASKQLNSALANLDFSPDQPLVNRKFGVVPINSKYSFMDDAAYVTMATVEKPSDLRKTHPYEIFDEAIYTCTSLPSSPAAGPSGNINQLQKLPKNHSLINSLGRFFKLLSTEESENSRILNVPPNRYLGERNELGPPIGNRHSKSMTSISTIPSVMSRSSSPSLLSYQSSPNSSNDISAESSVTSDSDSSSLLSDCLGSTTSSIYSGNSFFTQPPELFKVPPEIVRPNAKLDIVFDHEGALQKFARMQMANGGRSVSKFFGSGRASNLSFSTLPKTPKIPSVSIYLNLDTYNKFSITRDNFIIDEDVLSENEAMDLEAFSKNFAKHMRTPTDLMAVGRALNEWNAVVTEFEAYLFKKVEADQANYYPTSPERTSGASTINEIDELDYFQRIIPFMPIDNYTELKLLNAS